MNIDRNKNLIRKAEDLLYRVVDENEDREPDLIEIWNEKEDEPLYFDYFDFYIDGKRLRHVAAELEVGLVEAAKYVLNAEVRAIREFDT